MPTDPRRNQGPDERENYVLYSKDENVRAKESFNRVLENGPRKDGRKHHDLRKTYIKTGVVDQAKGSAYIELNETKVLVSVFEPREIPRLSEFTPNGELYCELKFAPFSCQERRGYLMDGEEKDLSLMLKRALEPAVCRHEFPNFQVDVYALVLDNDGSCLSAAITAAGLALVDAAIPMYDTLSSVTLGCQGEAIFVDPNVDEENVCKTCIDKNNAMGIMSLTYMPGLAQITELSEIGCVTMPKVIQFIDILIEKTTELSQVVKQYLLQNVEVRVLEEQNKSN